MRALRRAYGAGPLHLAGVLATGVVAAYALTRVLGEAGWVSVGQWFVAALLFHDLVLWPLYTVADRLLVGASRRARRRRSAPVVPWVNHVRAPAVISAVLLLAFMPLVLGLSGPVYRSITGFGEGVYLTNWLLVTGILFAASGVIYLVRVASARYRASRRRAAEPGPTIDAGNAGA